MRRRTGTTILLLAGAAAALAFAGERSAPLAAGGTNAPAAEWHLDTIADEATPDSSGNALNGTVRGVSLAPGRFGNAFAYAVNAPVSGVVSVPSSSTLQPASLTLLAWVRRDGSPGQYRDVVAKGARGCDAASYALTTGPNAGLAFYVDDGAKAVYTADAGQGIWDGRWHAVAGTFDGSAVRLYVDGKQMGSPTASSGPIAYARADHGQLLLGDYAGSCGDNHPYAYSGALDEVRLYPRALSSAEIAYLQTASASTPPELPPLTTTTTTTTTTATTTTTTTPPPPPPGPTVNAKLATPTTHPTAGRLVVLDPAGSSNAAGYAYDLDGSGRFATTCPGSEPVAYAIFGTAGQHDVRLRVADASGRAATTDLMVDVARSPVADLSTLAWCGDRASVAAAAAAYLTPSVSDVRAVGMDVTQGVVPLGTSTGSANVLSVLGSQYYKEDPPPATFLQKGGKTVVRVYAAAMTAPSAGEVRNVQMLLYGFRNGRLLAPGPLLSETGPLDVPLGPPFTTHAQRIGYGPGTGVGHGTLPAFTYTLPETWTQGRIRLLATPILTGPRPDELCSTDACKQGRSTVRDDVAFQNTGVVIVRTLRMLAPGDAALPDPATALDATTNLAPVALVPTGYQATLDMSAIAACRADSKKCPQIRDKNGNLVPDYDTSNATALGYVAQWVAANQPVGIDPTVKFMTVGIHNGYGLEARGVSQQYTYKSGCPTGRPGILCETPDSTPFASVDLVRPLTSVAHEIFHNLGRPHADASGDSGCGGGGDGRPDARGHIEAIGLDRHAGSGGSLQTPYKIVYPGLPGEQPELYDFMSYCTGGAEATSWLSAYNWSTVAGQWLSFLPVQDALVARTRAADGPALEVTGYTDKTGTHVVALEPVQGPARVPPPPADSPFRAVVTDADGKVIGDALLAVASGHIDTQGTGRAPGPIATFHGVVPAGGAARVRILLNGATAATVSRSAHSPVVKLIGPLGGTIGRAARVPVRWSATDADLGNLTIFADYSSDGGRSWRTVYAGPSTAGLTLPSTYFNGSANARLRVRATDGFNETTVVSGRLRAVGSPPAPTISSPSPGERFQTDAAVFVQGHAFDDAFHLLPGPRLRWYVGKKLVGVGTAASATDLPPGRDTVRLVAKERGGRTGSAQVTIRVVAARPFFVSLAAPAHASPRARTVRMTLATNETAKLRVAGQTFALSRRRRTITVRVVPGRATLQLPLRLSAYGKTAVTTARIRRG
jgi:hypothetical protein